MSVLLALSFASGVLVLLLWLARSRKPLALTTTSSHKANTVAFAYPAFLPNIDFDIERTPPLPYRPFRWGPTYFVTMGIRNMEWQDWIELDCRFSQYHAIRSQRIQTRGEDAVCILPASPTAPSGVAAAKELVYELSEYLSRRYPQVYTVTRHPPDKSGGFGWYGDGQIKTIHIRPSEVTYDLDQQNPMMISGLLVQDDLAIMMEGCDGRYYFQAGAVCTAGFWRLKDKIGLPLDEIHTRGHVPQYEDKLQTSLARFFSKMRVDKPVLRNNYFFQIVRDESGSTRTGSIDPDELAWSDTTNGNEDRWDHTNQRGDPTPPASIAANIRFRTERQSLRRLPRTGAIVFTVRTYLEPIVDIAKEPGVPGRMAAAIRSMGLDILRYKGAHLWKEALLSYLDKQHTFQIAEGMVDANDRDNNYPF